MGVIVQTKVTPDPKKVQRELDRARRELANLETPNRQAAAFLDRWVQRNFKTEGQLVGGWKPFARGGRRGDTTAKLLQDTGRLRLSFLPFADRRTAGVGSRLPYSVVHQRGLRGVPQRRVLPEAREVREDLRKIYGHHVRVSVVARRYA